MASFFSAAVASSLQLRRWKYDVFLSFRGEDTRKGFTGHLYEGLRNRGIFTFQDDKRLEHGSSISKELSKAIEDSQVAIVVFSTNYAASSWCLNELVKIMECQIQFGQRVIPVFYDVDPSIVRHQKESFAKAFGEHESRLKDDVEGMQKVHKWKTALTHVANLKGYDIRQGIESEHIQLIVDEISPKLYKRTFLQGTVGINTHLEKVMPLIDIEINDVRIVGIWGMGGVGKTTIARSIFDALSYQFEAACFLADIKETERHQLHSLQNTLLSNLLRKEHDYVYNRDDGKCVIPDRLRFKKVLIVLDDIDREDHLEYLAGDLDWFGEGSRILVTTRNKHLIGEKNVVYEVTTLADPEAIQLFNRYAFKDKAPDECFEKLTLEVVTHASGLPLALKVWGSLLYRRDLAKWRNVVDQIKKNPSLEIVEKLKISYDGLEPEEKEIFLDIACLFRGHPKEKVMQILESCDFGAECGLDILIERCLVFISAHNKIEMHDLLQDMGKYIVNLQKNPWERSRIWLTKDFEDVMISNMGTNAAEVIWLPQCQELCFRKEAIKNMRRLRILQIDYAKDGSGSRDGSIEYYMPNNLRWLSWKKYPWESFSENFEPRRIAYLNLSWSTTLRHLWMGVKDLSCLRTLNLSYSSSLLRTPDFTRMPNLEYLDLSICISLEEVHDSLGNCNKLIRLYLNDCRSLKRFPCVNVESLKELRILDCCSLEKFPEILGKMNQTHLRELDVSHLKMLIALPSSIGRLKSLRSLYVSECSQLESLPEEIGDLENLEKLSAESTLISRPPSSIVCLNKLEFLSFANSGADAVHFVFPQVNDGLRSLQNLDLSYCNLIDGGLPEDIGCLSTLRRLRLRGNNFKRLPQSIAQLARLFWLDIAECKRLNELPELPPNIETLHADFQITLTSIHSLASKYKKLLTVKFPCIVEEDMFAESLFQCISALDSSCQRLIYIEQCPLMDIPSWFSHQESNSLCVDLRSSWHANGNFLGFVICTDNFYEQVSIELLPSSNNPHPKPVKLSKTLAFAGPSVKYDFYLHVVFIPLASLWDTSKAKGATPNDYAHFKITAIPVDEVSVDLGCRLLYKDGTERKFAEVCGSSPENGQSQVEEMCALQPLHFYPFYEDEDSDEEEWHRR